MFVKYALAACVAGGLIVSAAHADPLRDAAESAAACRTIADDTSRLICLDAAAIALSNALGTPAAAAPTVAEPAEPQTPKWAKAPEARKPEPVETASAATTESEQGKPPIWARVLRRNNKNPDDDVYAVSITRILKNKQGRFFFITEDGQEWRQVQIKDVRAPKSLPAPAVIERSVTGSPKLSFDSVPGRTYKVRRIE